MASPKSGNAGSPVAPAEPVAALDAIDDASGEVSKAEFEKAERKLPNWTKDETKTSWIEIELVDENGKGIAGEPYEVETSDGKLCAGTLDHKGFKRIEHLEPGTCKITFPRLDKEAWEPV